MPPHTSDDTRARMERIFLLLKKHSQGLRESEIADALRIHRRSVNNYLADLEREGRIYKDGVLWLPHSFTPAVIRPLEVQAEEATVLYLAARMLVKQSDRRNEIAETLLLKLAHVLKTDAGVADHIEEAARELAQRPDNREFINIFRLVAQSYLYHRKLKIVYQPYQGQPFTTQFAPYLIEPSMIGFSTYVIGFSEVSQALRTYKVERILDAKLLREEYHIPTDFPGLELLRNAWSIYYGEKTVTVVLRFHPDVAKRVQETQWHPSQQIMPDDHDMRYIRLCLQVADTTDLIPWIRTWGANCEVLEPEDLRSTLMGEARRLAQMYGVRQEKLSDDDPLGLDQTLGDYFG